MKIWFVLCWAVVLTLNVMAQNIAEPQVPAAVLNAFQQKFSDATDVKWETKGDLYKGEFKVGTRGHDVWIDKSGKITKHKEDFPKKNLPSEIQQHLATEFKAYKLDDADKIETDEKIFYQVKLDGPSDDRQVLFTADGKVVENTID